MPNGLNSLRSNMNNSCSPPSGNGNNYKVIGRFSNQQNQMQPIESLIIRKQRSKSVKSD
jgi:hypothetical protein